MTGVRETPQPRRSASPPARLLAGGSAVLLVVATLVPWWRAEIPLSRVAETLNAWQLLTLGFSIAPLGEASGYSAVGNVLFGLAPTLPLLVLIALLTVRAVRPAALPVSLLLLYGVFSLLGLLWLVFFASLRVDASNGVFPLLPGAWVAFTLSLAVTVVAGLWWGQERPRRAKRPAAGAEGAASVPVSAGPAEDDPWQQLLDAERPQSARFDELDAPATGAKDEER